MTRMSKEFSLVLLGASILTAGSFVYPEEDLEARADHAAAQQVAGNNTRARTGFHPGLVFIHTGRWGGGTTTNPARAGVSRGGFGSVGHAVSVSS
jgi:hypothetical protein